MPKTIETITSAFIAVACVGCDSHAYYSEAVQYHALAREALIANNVCENEQDCFMKDILFAEGGSISLGFFHWGGAYITLYETQDAALVESIIAKFRELHSQL